MEANFYLWTLRQQEMHPALSTKQAWPSRETLAEHTIPPLPGFWFEALQFIELGGAMRRREFILGSAATAWSVTARAQQDEKVKRIGVVLPAAADDAEVQIWLAARGS